jgi:hypothetical protein
MFDVENVGYLAQKNNAKTPLKRREIRQFRPI